MGTETLLPSGLRTRAGNTMSRTRDGLLDGALSVIERVGVRRLTMAAVAQRSGVAKATLYNHFRTKDEVLAALVDREVRLVAQRSLASLAAGSAVDGLDRAAADLAEHLAVRRLVASEPEVVLLLLTPGDAQTWTLVRAALGELLGGDAEPARLELALTWLLGQLVAPQEPELRRRSAELLADGVR